METVIGLVAVVFVTGMVLWMSTHARFLKRDLEGAASSALTEGTSWALVAMAFLAVLREGFESAVFLLATFQASTSTASAVIGAVARHPRRRRARLRHLRRRGPAQPGPLLLDHQRLPDPRRRRAWCSRPPGPPTRPAGSPSVRAAPSTCRGSRRPARSAQPWSAACSASRRTRAWSRSSRGRRTWCRWWSSCSGRAAGAPRRSRCRPCGCCSRVSWRPWRWCWSWPYRSRSRRSRPPRHSRGGGTCRVSVDGDRATLDVRAADGRAETLALSPADSCTDARGLAPGPAPGAVRRPACRSG